MCADRFFVHDPSDENAYICVCMYVYMYVCMYKHVCIYIYIYVIPARGHIHTCIHRHSNIYICIYIFIDAAFDMISNMQLSKCVDHIYIHT